MNLSIITEALWLIAEITLYIILTVWSVTSILCLAIKVWRNRKKGEQPLPHWIRKLY